MTNFNFIKKHFFVWSISILCINLAFSQDTLENGFENPPSNAKALTWWHWINGNVTKEGITADLEAMKEVGIQGAQLFNVSLGQPQGNANYLSEEWLDLFEFSAQEAHRLGMELAFHNCPGWSSSGGPWITPEYAMQSVVFTDTVLRGAQKFQGQLAQPETRLNYYKDIAIFAFPKPQSDERIIDLDFKNLSGRVRNHLAPDEKVIPSSALLRHEDILDLTSSVASDGTLEWDVPDGEWIILRLGHTPTGAYNRFASEGGRGLECDKMSKKAVDVFWEGGIRPIIEKLDTLIGTVVTKCHIDSYEVGPSNWTSDFVKEFKRLRSYDCMAYLPTLAGYYVESGEQTERFLWDFRRTIGDLTAEHYYGRFSELCHQHGMKFSVEPYWGPFDNMQVGATADLVMAEFWSGSLAFFDSPKFVASIAKLNGCPIAEAEAFTALGGWNEHPAALKAMGDRAWAQGINRFVFHTYVHQPWEVPPGLTLGIFGIDFNRHNTWWKQGKGFLDYIARSQFLLQQGTVVADVLVFTGEASPNDALLIPEIKAMGYDYDLIGSNKLNTLSVKDGFIRTENGDEYQFFVLPNTEWLKPETLSIIEELAKAGATILGAQPRKSPSLENYPHCDREVMKTTKELWGKKLVRDESIVDVLKHGALAPDFQIENGVSNNIDFIHRKAGKADIYFISNSHKESKTEYCRFRIRGKQPELWNAETGEITDALVWKDNGDGTTTVPIQLKPEDAIFVIFQDSIIPSENIVETKVKHSNQSSVPLPNLKIIQAEYGTFLGQALVDVTDVLSEAIVDGKLDIKADRDLCKCDPAPGYHKELRMEYLIDGAHHEIEVMEKEQLTIEVGGDFEIKKAIFGKFARGVDGLPESGRSIDITKIISSQINAGIYEIPVNDALLNGESLEGENKSLHIIYSSNGEVHERFVQTGETLKLSQDLPASIFTEENGKVLWNTPYAGAMTYQNTSGDTRSVKVKSVPEPIEICTPWEVCFPDKSGVLQKYSFNCLHSWSENEIDEIRYFSGTASYRNTFTVPKKLLKHNTSLELDLGKVAVIAEVIVNGKNAGTLWKTPFRIGLDGLVHAGENSLEIKVTNLWPNRLIGDAHFQADYKRKGPNIKEWAEWLENPSDRPSERTTFSAFKHWDKNAELLPSGLLGPVLIRPYVKKKVKF